MLPEYTYVFTDSGWVPIDAIQVGTSVFTYDISTGQMRWGLIVSVEVFTNVQPSPALRAANAIRLPDTTWIDIDAGAFATIVANPRTPIVVMRQGEHRIVQLKDALPTDLWMNMPRSYVRVSSTELTDSELISNYGYVLRSNLNTILIKQHGTAAIVGAR